jgi:hypothetical protein
MIAAGVWYCNTHVEGVHRHKGMDTYCIALRGEWNGIVRIVRTI